MKIQKLHILLPLLIAISSSAIADVVISGSTVLRSVGAVNLNINQSVELKTTSILQLDSNSVNSVSGDFTNDATVTAELTSDMIFDGAGNQSFDGATTFADFEVEKASGNINFSNGSNLTVLENFTLNSVADGVLSMRDSAKLFVNGSSIRTGLGHVDGVIGQQIDTGNDDEKLIPVGMGTHYVPLQFDIAGVGGTQGYVEFIADSLDQNVAPSTISIPEVVERQWILSAGTGFDLGGRNYDLNINYINPGDLRNGANPNDFLVARKTTELWVLPTVGNVTASSVEGESNDSLGLFIVGPEAEYLTFYSRETGDFSTASNWSLYDYGSFPAPYSPRTQDFSYIADSDEITLDADLSTFAGRGVFLVQGGSSNTTGALYTEEYTIDGPGTFSMVAGSTLGIGSDDGITNGPANSGNIQTAVRDYNPGNHNDGIFIYNSTSAGSLSLGDGLPTTVQDLIIRSTGTYDLTTNMTITDDFLIESGGIDIGSNTVTGGDAFAVDDGGTLVIGGTNDFTAVTGFSSYVLDINSNIGFDGVNQTISNFPANFNTALGFGNLWIDNTGIALVSDPILVRNTLDNENGGNINNTGPTSSITVYNCFTNNGILTNSAGIFIGETP